jgi:hypothetical protein
MAGGSSGSVDAAARGRDARGCITGVPISNVHEMLRHIPILQIDLPQCILREREEMRIRAGP